MTALLELSSLIDGFILDGVEGARMPTTFVECNL